MTSFKKYLQETQFEHGDEFFGGDPRACYAYAAGVVRGPWPEAEKYIRRDPKYALMYLRTILKNKWFQMHDYTVEDKISLLFKYKIDQDILDGLNFLGMEPEVQEALIKKRPDLIGEIENLDPEVARKHQHEAELGRTDL